ncbi:MAG: winged helix-turn-helix domain-containing protein [Methanosarcinaceae archaeon]|nr:winged helix-turn-helix domain-containing protein [Methanosarcinaceae archaeon]MDD4330885.1 winged helix-turn-helix domain-containing protein [Methanosarcinaceae archaeon]MDD4748852.1 winged helix-turn-helix domain-containing protein [Methanosarcinaceae archaeon]
MLVNITNNKINTNGGKLFKAISSDTRLSILERLSEGEIHISGIARELGISVPVAAKHVKILEEAELVERKKFGNLHMIGIKLNNVYSLLDHFAENSVLEVEKGTNLLEALKAVAAVEITKVGSMTKVISTDGEKGLYLYEVNGKSPDKTVDEFRFDEDAIVEWKKLVPVTKKRLFVNVKKEKAEKT